MAKTIEFKVKSSKSFTSYLKKFASIDNTVLFEVDLEKSRFVTKSTNSERSIVKYAVLPFSEAEFEVQSRLNIRIKVGIYNISRLIKIIEQFGNDFELVIKYDELVGANDQKDYAALSILVKDEELKFNTECTSLNIFKYITDSLYENTIRKVTAVTTFDLSKESIEKIRALSELDRDHKLIEFKIQSGNLFAQGRSFKFLISPTSSKDISISFYKTQFDKVDVEKCKVQMGADRMLFSSDDSISETITSRVEGNEKFEETIEDF